MTPNIQHIRIPLTAFGKNDYLDIYPENQAGLYEISNDEADENGESIYQILEGNTYEYAFTNRNLRLNCRISGIVSQSKRELFAGRIVPNIYVGTLTLIVSDVSGAYSESAVTLEVLATKFDTAPDKSYRENYRFMLKEITDRCTELLMQLNSPVEQHFETDFSRDSSTIYQRYSFVSSVIQNKDFEEAVLKIVSAPKTTWSTEAATADLRSTRRLNNAVTKQIASGNNRFPLQNSHPLYAIGMTSLPQKINSIRKVEHTDTPENRFIKHALEVFLRFAENCATFFKENKYPRPQAEATYLVSVVERYLNHSFFKNISRPSSL